MPISELIQDRLTQLLASGRVPHLLIFSSPDNSLANQTAKYFACQWLKTSKQNHPDLSILETSGKTGMHSVENIRRMGEALSLTPYGENGKAVIIENAERMLPSASNTLLKMLEEPPQKSLILLTTHSLQRLLPTVLSRGQIIRIPACLSIGIPNELSELLEGPVPILYADIVKVAKGIHEQIVEEATLSNENQKKENSYEEMSATSKKDLEAHSEGFFAIITQQNARSIIENTYLCIRNRELIDSSLHLELIQQALDAIDRGGDLPTVLPWYLSQVVSET